MRYLFIIAIAMLCGCSPSSLNDFRHEGEARTRRLISDLQKIHHREELQEAAPRLKNHFEALVDIMIESKRYLKTHPDERVELLAAEDWSTSDELRLELMRIYGIEGGREMIERAQHEALLRLDAFNKGLSERKNSRGK